MSSASFPRLVLASVILLLSLCLSSLANAQKAYGWNLNNASDPRAVGPCSIDLANPTAPLLLRQHDFAICAGAFAGKKYYAYTYKSLGNASQPIALVRYSFETGELETIADYSAMKTLFYDMAYDYKNRVMYALGLEGNRSTLLSVDLTSGRVSKLAQLSQRFVSLAIDLSGQLFAESLYGYLTQLSPAGAETELNGGDYTPMELFQSMAFDHKTGKLWWVIPTAREGTQLLTLDKANGYVQKNVALPHDVQIVGFDLPFSHIKDGAPGEMSSFGVQPDKEGALEATIELSAPTKTSGGGTLGAFTVRLYRNGKEIKAFQNARPGERLTHTDKVSQNALYTYSAFAENGEGPGEEVSSRIFVGEDLPSAVSTIFLEKLSRTSCRIRWKSPTVGANGGYISPSLSYSVTRLPDNKVIASGISATTVVDEEAQALNNYRYRIVPKGNKGEGLSAESEYMILGEAIKPPYSCRFTDEDFVFWKVIDANGDGRTWKRDMVNGVSCPYAKVTGNDWLISSPILLEAEKRYKLVISAASYDQALVERMGIYMGLGPEVADMKTQLGDFVVSNPEGGRANYTVYIPKREKTAEHTVGIWMHSDPDKYQLTVYELHLTEARSGSLSGSVSHAGNPVSGAQVWLEGTEWQAKSAVDGSWSLKNVPEGRYTLRVKKEGFAEEGKEIEVTEGATLEVKTLLRPLERVAVAGSVHLGSTAKPAPEVRLSLYTPKANASDKPLYTTITTTDGSFRFDGVFEGRYRLAVFRPGLERSMQEVFFSARDTTLAPIKLAEKRVPPRMLRAEHASNGDITLHWLRPTDTDSIVYYKGEGVARLGVEQYGPRSVMGTVYRRAMAISEVSWMTSDHRGPHKEVDLVIFALDATGEPTKNILFEAKKVPNLDNQWTSYAFEKPLALPQGALIALRYNGYLSLLADAGVQGGLAFEPRVHLLNGDYDTRPFEYLDRHNMEKNYLIGVKAAALDEAGKEIPTMQLARGFEVLRKADKEGATWTTVANLPSETMTFTDTGWKALPHGYYCYGVRALYGEGKSSEITQTDKLGKDLSTTVRFEVTTNAGAPETHPSVELLNADNVRERYKATPGADGKLMIKDLPKGLYHLEGELDGFEPLRMERLSFETENTYTSQLNFVERILPAYNLKASLQKEAFARKIVWNEENYIFDGFESYPSFTLEPASAERNWIYWDLDRGETVEFTNVSFPHMGEKMSFIVFNPSETTPKLSVIDRKAMPYAGDKYIAAFANRKGACRNFLFSPILSFDGKVEVAMQARSFVPDPQNDKIRVGYTSLAYPTTESDITWLSDTISLPAQWQAIREQLPEEAKRAVIGHFSRETFFVMIDNLFVGEPSLYADGSIKKPQHDRASYRVMLDGKQVAAGLKATELKLKKLSPGKHQLSVTAVYVSGEAKPVELSFTVAQKESATEVEPENKPSLYPNPAKTKVRISGRFAYWYAFTTTGVRIAEGNANTLDVSSWPAGIYFVRLTYDNQDTTVKLRVE